MWAGVVPQQPPTRLSQAVLGEAREHPRHRRRGVVVGAELVGQAGVRVAHDPARVQPRQLGDVGPHLLGAERAVDADREQVVVGDRGVDRLDVLARQRAARAIRDRHRRDHGHPPGAAVEQLGDRVQRRLHVERVDVGLGQQQVDAALEQRLGLRAVGRDQLVERDRAEAGVVDVGRQGRGLGGRPDRAGDEARLAVGALGALGGAAGDLGGGEVDVGDVVAHLVVLGRDRVGTEGVGLDDVGAGLEELEVDVLDRRGLGEHQQVVEAAQAGAVAGEAIAAERRLVEPQRLDHRPHRAVEDDDAVTDEGLQELGTVGHRPSVARSPGRANGPGAGPRSPPRHIGGGAGHYRA